MGRKAKNDADQACCGKPVNVSSGDCRVEAMISVDERGQMVLPKELRDKVGIRAGDKLVVMSWQNDGDVCCISLVKTDYFMGVLKDRLGPMMNDLTSNK